MQGKTEEEIEMMKLMGFGNFDTSKVRVVLCVMQPQGGAVYFYKVHYTHTHSMFAFISVD